MLEALYVCSETVPGRMYCVSWQIGGYEQIWVIRYGNSNVYQQPVNNAGLMMFAIGGCLSCATR